MNAAEPGIGYFVTGTDTGVGKTLVSCALLHALRARHRRVVGMKPVSAGVADTPQGRLNEDVIALRAASTASVDAALDNPYSLDEPISPHLAAQRMGLQIELPLIRLCYERLAASADAVVVEGAGGFFAPLSQTQTVADLAQVLGLPVILVVGIRLGCLSHALLTQEAIAARGLRLMGWVANRIDPWMLAADGNVATLCDRIAAPLLVDVAWQSVPSPEAIEIRWPPGVPA